MKPYYEQDGITIYHGDCRDVLPTLADGSIDLVLTDPPYGIGEAAGKNRSRGCFAKARDFGVAGWDDKPIEPDVMRQVRQAGRKAIIFGGNYYEMPASSCWLVWDKDNGATDFADCELAWTNLPKAVRRIVWKWQGMLQQDMANKEYRWHPTQKPLPVMRWCIQQAGDDVQTILDPFMGSGTTLRAAKDLGRRAIGIEIEERYVDIAIKRLQQQTLPLHSDEVEQGQGFCQVPMLSGMATSTKASKVD